jgi:hypothetical protein
MVYMFVAASDGSRPLGDASGGRAARRRRVGELSLDEHLLDTGHALVERLVESREVVDRHAVREDAITNGQPIASIAKRTKTLTRSGRTCQG